MASTSAATTPSAEDQTRRVPGFAFAWLELVSHRALTPELLAVSGQRGWPLVHRLLLP